MNSRHVLLADKFYNWSNGTALIYNHGIYGYSDEDRVKLVENLINGGRGGDGLPSVSSINRAFGDGHVEYKERREFNKTIEGTILNTPMKGTDSSPYRQPHVAGWSGDANFY